MRQVLSHTAGLPAFPVPRPATAIADWALLTGDLAAADPEWSPGSVAGEHAWTYGHLVGELVRRVDGRSVGRFLAEEIADRWQLDLGFGLTEADQRRCADLRYGDPGWPSRALGEAGSLRARAMGNPAGGLDLAVLNSPMWRGAEVPAVNLHATAPSLARLYAGLLAGGVLDGVRLFSPELVAEATGVQYDGPDLVLDRDAHWTLGMQWEPDGSWGMGGIGGSSVGRPRARLHLRVRHGAPRRARPGGRAGRGAALLPLRPGSAQPDGVGARHRERRWVVERLAQASGSRHGWCTALPCTPASSGTHRRT